MDPMAPTGTDGFDSLGLRPELLHALSELGYEEPTPIQQEAIPPIIAGHDLLGQAATGTGKTAAFALPILQRLTGGGKHPEALVLVPTRELAMQVSEAIHRYGRGINARVVPIYGGQPIVRQLQALDRGVDVVVATPGRALDHLKRGSLSFGAVQLVVLDEADEMLDMGFAEDIEALLEAVPEDRQTVLFSATLPPRIAGIVRRHLTDPVRIEIERETPAAGQAPLVEQRAYVVPRSHKPAALGRILDVESPAAAIVFCRTRTEVDALTETLNGRGYRAEALHGGMDQQQRDRVMTRVRSGATELLVATDVAARGLDVEHLTHVVNYDVPSAPEAYVHRIGRVGRAGREGVAITLVEPREHRLLQNIERATKRKLDVERVPTIADLRNRRLENTLATLRETLVDGELEHFQVVVDALSTEFDLVDIALAAVKLAHEASSGSDDAEEIPEARIDQGRVDRGKGKASSAKPGAGPARHARTGEAMTRLFVNAGRMARLRPNDLVGAIANETSLSGREIGAIEITDKFSIVEVPERAADEVIAAITRSTVKGRKVAIRRDNR
jgi:ATP-dependent RNA helicase DeaD